MFKSAFIVMAPDGDPKKHRATIKTSKLEFTTVIIEMQNFDQAVEVAKELVQKQGVQSIYICAGFTHQAVGRVAAAVGDGVAVQVARGDPPSTMMVEETLGKEGWFGE
jgi:threonine dehydratase